MELYVPYRDYIWMMTLVEELISEVAVALTGRRRCQPENARSISRLPGNGSPCSTRSWSSPGTPSAGREMRSSAGSRKSCMCRWKPQTGGKIVDRYSARRSSIILCSRHSSPITRWKCPPLRRGTVRRKGVDEVRGVLQRPGALQRLHRAERPARPASRFEEQMRAKVRGKPRSSRSTRTSFARWNTACLRRPGSGSGSTG